jgi:hypothetical protein
LPTRLPSRPLGRPERRDGCGTNEAPPVLAAPGVEVTDDAVVVADVAVEMPSADMRFDDEAVLDEADEDDDDDDA